MRENSQLLHKTGRTSVITKNALILNIIQNIYNLFDTEVVLCITLVLLRPRVIVFEATFSNISVISWRLVLLVEETTIPGENHRSVAKESRRISHHLNIR
jgi:hypothetical protein